MLNFQNQNTWNHISYHKEDPRVLIIRDSDASIRSPVCKAKENGLQFSVHVASTSEAALVMLKRWSSAQSQRCPVVVVLDLDLPGRKGLRLLEAFCSNPILGNVPVFVHSSSDANDVKHRAYKLGIAGYIVKGRDHASEQKFFNMLHQYLKCVVLPH